MSGLPTNKAISAFAVDPSKPQTMYAATGDGLFRSADAGVTWKGLGENLKDLAAIAINPKKANEIYTTTAPGIIVKSADGGMKWQRQSGILVK